MQQNHTYVTPSSLYWNLWPSTLTQYIIFACQNYVVFLSGVDECSLGTDTCDVNADCIDTEGSFSCTCHVGFSGDGESCCMYNILWALEPLPACTLTYGAVKLRHLTLFFYLHVHDRVCLSEREGE